MTSVLAFLLLFPTASHAHVSRRSLTSTYVRPRRELSLKISEILHNTECEDPPCSSQVHVTLGELPDEAVVSFASTRHSTPSEVTFQSPTDGSVRLARGEATSYSQLLFFDSYLMDPPMGRPSASKKDLLKIEDTSSWANGTASWSQPTEVTWGEQMYNNPQAYYGSPIIHQVTLRGLKSNTQYSYRIPNDSRNHFFKMPKFYPPKSEAAGVQQESGQAHSYVTPFRVGLVADIGQTPSSAASVRHLANHQPDVVFLAGDLSYADGYYWRWDSFGALFEPLASKVPVLTCPGNHEVGSGEQFQSYNIRWRMPHKHSGSTSNTYWSREIGPIHLITLNSYSPTAPGSLQYEWLQSALKRVERRRTPWLFVMFHAPFYCSNTGHIEETRLMRKDLEKMLYDAGTDVVLSGHVHAYERTHPVFDYKVDNCGPTYIMIGDGGNREGAYLPWREPQPEWSAFREGSFGIGLMEVVNETHIKYEWRRHSCMGSEDPDNINFNSTCRSKDTHGHVDNGSTEPSESVWLVKPTQQCLNRETASVGNNSAASPGGLRGPDGWLSGFSADLVEDSVVVLPRGNLMQQGSEVQGLEAGKGSDCRRESDMDVSSEAKTSLIVLGLHLSISTSTLLSWSLCLNAALFCLLFVSAILVYCCSRDFMWKTRKQQTISLDTDENTPMAACSDSRQDREKKHLTRSDG
uniref:Purple acid phosphatase n=1 Tax=Chromera velia CCMP2878 TaxID=1169474 RepID=A0A0G4FPE9_9ALVE|eukprot:Cvel_18085.t1-p1 / transcript=Cvel_18085.t1 / gene=Cvel_18085 / organism=Chromera_velia_CCMP2878 / gene_product=Purple acid phosphatase 21, putative / transcript_product=Purple acid phosphatase 21, putative / location=Cvel_scaffold1481:3510-7904(-) / protein_length=690 / sequence_SO=supercontig / SO=protein_coding / is_pseudo=false